MACALQARDECGKLATFQKFTTLDTSGARGIQNAENLCDGMLEDIVACAPQATEECHSITGIIALHGRHIFIGTMYAAPLGLENIFDPIPMAAPIADILCHCMAMIINDVHVKKMKSDYKY